MEHGPGPAPHSCGFLPSEFSFATQRMGMAKRLLVTRPPSQAGDRALGVPSSGPTSLGEQQRDGNP